MTNLEQLLEALESLAGVEPVVTVEPAGITDWSVERSLKGRVLVTPPDLERVTIAYTDGQHAMTAVIYDRERDIVHAFELAEFWSRHA
jgi:hypothetical protein